MKLFLVVLAVVLLSLQVSAWGSPPKSDSWHASNYKRKYDTERDPTAKAAYWHLHYFYKYKGIAAYKVAAYYWGNLGFGYYNLYKLYQQPTPVTQQAIHHRMQAESFMLYAVGRQAEYRLISRPRDVVYQTVAKQFKAKGLAMARASYSNFSVKYFGDAPAVPVVEELNAGATCALTSSRKCYQKVYSGRECSGTEHRYRPNGNYYTTLEQCVNRCEQLGSACQAIDFAAHSSRCKDSSLNECKCYTVPNCASTRALSSYNVWKRSSNCAGCANTVFSLDCNSWKTAYDKKIKESIAQTSPWRKMSLQGIADYYYWKYMWCKKDNSLHWGLAMRANYWGRSWLSVYDMFRGSNPGSCQLKAAYNAAEANRAWGNSHFWTYAFKHSATTWRNGDKYAAVWKANGDSFETRSEAACPKPLPATSLESDSSVETLGLFRRMLLNRYQSLLAENGADEDSTVGSMDFDSEDSFDPSSAKKTLVNTGAYVAPAQPNDEIYFGTLGGTIEKVAKKTKKPTLAQVSQIEDQELFSWTKACDRYFNGETEKLCLAIVTFVGQLKSAFKNTFSWRGILGAVTRKDSCYVFIKNKDVKSVCDSSSKLARLATTKEERVLHMVRFVMSLFARVKQLAAPVAKAFQDFQKNLVDGITTWWANRPTRAPGSYMSLGGMRHQFYSQYCGSLVQDVMKALAGGNCCSQAIVAGVELINDIGWIGYGYPPSVTGALDAGECMAYAQSMCATGNTNAC